MEDKGEDKWEFLLFLESFLVFSFLLVSYA